VGAEIVEHQVNASRVRVDVFEQVLPCSSRSLIRGLSPLRLVQTLNAPCAVCTGIRRAQPLKASGWRRRISATAMASDWVMRGPCWRRCWLQFRGMTNQSGKHEAAIPFS
jgi:hypothetical protein